MRFIQVGCFDDWRAEARTLLSDEIAPNRVHWSPADKQLGLFDQIDGKTTTDKKTNTSLNDGKKSPQVSVPSPFLELARHVACHRDPKRWQLLYQTLWRIVHGERRLLEISTDNDVHRLQLMKKAVRRDVHKMKAFVRFRKIEVDKPFETYIAWHRPDHQIVRLAAPFFSRRFKGMSWTILTPHESAHWDQQQLTFGPGLPASQAPQSDALEDLWKTYYASIFNPARIKLDMMKREMPIRHWPTLPEATLIEDLIREAPTRVNQMIENHEGFAETAASYLPIKQDLKSLRQSVKNCRACHLCNDATQAVFGMGPQNARLVLVGEQPGDREDIEGKPFVGPAGELLNALLRHASIKRRDVYFTNVVKHFKFERQGKRRLHKKPDSREIYACRPWLESELMVLQPKTMICLGATAAQALLGRDFRLSQQRGDIHVTEWSERTMATWHPSAILRMTNTSRKREMIEQLVRDLKLGNEILG